MCVVCSLRVCFIVCCLYKLNLMMMNDFNISPIKILYFGPEWMIVIDWETLWVLQSQSEARLSKKVAVVPYEYDKDIRQWLKISKTHRRKLQSSTSIRISRHLGEMWCASRNLDESWSTTRAKAHVQYRTTVGVMTSLWSETAERTS